MRLNKKNLKKLILQETNNLIKEGKIVEVKNGNENSLVSRNKLRQLIRKRLAEGGLAGMASHEHEMMDEPLPGTFGHSRGAIDDLDMAAGRAMGFDDGPLSMGSSFVADEFNVDPEAERRYEEAKRNMPNLSLSRMLKFVFG